MTQLALMCNCTPSNQWAKLLVDSGADVDTSLQLGPSENTRNILLLITACIKAQPAAINNIVSLFGKWLANITPLGLAGLIGNYQVIEYFVSIGYQV